jgi:hypothetical protein
MRDRDAQARRRERIYMLALGYIPIVLNFPSSTIHTGSLQRQPHKRLRQQYEQKEVLIFIRLDLQSTSLCPGL